MTESSDKPAPLVVVNNAPPAEQPEQTASEDWAPVLDYLKSPQGHEVAQRVLGIVETLQKNTLVRGNSVAKWDRVIQAAIVAAVLLSGTVLAALGKFTSEIGVVLVAVLGYTLRRNS